MERPRPQASSVKMADPSANHRSNCNFIVKFYNRLRPDHYFLKNELNFPKIKYFLWAFLRQGLPF